MNDKSPATRISTFDATGATIRGKNLVEDLIGEISFTEMIYFYVLGSMPAPSQKKILDAVLVTLVDHGVVGALSSRMVYRASPDSIQGAMAAGLLAVGSQFGGVMEQVGRHLEEIMEADDADATADEIVKSYRSSKRALPGFGHSDFKPEDPRTPKLLAVAEGEDIPGKHIAALHVMSAAVDRSLGKHLTINATAGMAALLGEIGVPWKVMRGFAAISRAPGLLGHILEEQHLPLGRHVAKMLQDTISYDGEEPSGGAD